MPVKEKIFYCPATGPAIHKVFYKVFLIDNNQAPVLWTSFP